MTAILTDRFWSKVDKTAGDCWLWTGALNSRGYGCWAIKRRSQLAHRISYTAHVGPIPGDLTIDHLCRVKRCVNPEHLEVVTRSENSRRGHQAAHPAAPRVSVDFADIVDRYFGAAS